MSRRHRRRVLRRVHLDEIATRPPQKRSEAETSRLLQIIAETGKPQQTERSGTA